MGRGESPAVVWRRLRLSVRSALGSKALTQGEVAKRLEWSLSKVNRIEGGEVTVCHRDLQVLLGLIDITGTDRIGQFSADVRASRRRGWWDAPNYREFQTTPTMELRQLLVQAQKPNIWPQALDDEASSRLIEARAVAILSAYGRRSPYD